MTAVKGQHGHVNRIQIEPFNCEICGERFRGEWSDLYGEAMCLECGAPYYLVKYDKYPEIEPPMLGFSKEFADAFREHWKETGRRVRTGTIVMSGDYPGYVDNIKSLIGWMARHHPELVKKEVN